MPFDRLRCLSIACDVFQSPAGEVASIAIAAPVTLRSIDGRQLALRRPLSSIRGQVSGCLLSGGLLLERVSGASHLRRKAAPAGRTAAPRAGQRYLGRERDGLQGEHEPAALLGIGQAAIEWRRLALLHRE